MLIIKSIRKWLKKLLSEMVTTKITFTGWKLFSCFNIFSIYQRRCPKEDFYDDHIGEAKRIAKR